MHFLINFLALNLDDIEFQIRVFEYFLTAAYSWNPQVIF